jgi:dTDP-4-dehydrorhamnose reductase
VEASFGSAGRGRASWNSREMILVFGRTGQVARELHAFSGVIALGRDEVDLLNPSKCQEAIRDIKPDFVINAAAYTAVDQAEEEEEVANLINGRAPTLMANTCAGLSIPLVHISTDYVFDGNGDRPFSPECETQPINAYGRSKLMGEEGVQSSGAVFAILRTSWVVSASGKNFVKTMLDLSRERDEFRIVEDQVGGLTPACDIAEACIAIGKQLVNDPNKRGVYHLSGTPNTSWAEVAREIFRQTQKDIDVIGIPASDFPTDAKRPLNSRMDCGKTEKVFGIKRPDWRSGIKKILTELEVLHEK